MSHRHLPLAVLGAILLAGSSARLADLDRRDFRDDELFQYYAAESIDRGEGPRLPSGKEYRRGIDVTRMVQLSVRHLGPTPTAIRLPSAVMGVIGLFVFAAILWAVAGPWPAVWGTFLLAVYPEGVVQARQLRFYTYQMVFGLLALYTGWRALRPAGARAGPSRGTFLRQWLWASATIALLLLAARVQIVSLSILAGWGVAALVAAAADVAARGRGAWRRSAPVQIVAFGAFVLIVVLLVRPDVPAELLDRARHAPYWAILGQRTHPLTYYGALRTDFPVLLALLPLIFLSAIARRPRLGVYLTVWFAVPMVLHSLVLTWKEVRFVLLAMPALFAATGVSAAWGAGGLLRGTAELSRRWGIPPRLHRPVAYAVVGVTSITILATLPAVLHTRAVVRADRESASRWTTSAAIIRSTPGLDSIPAGTGYALHGLYYWPRLDFVVRVHGLERSVTREPDGSWHVELNPMGSPEYKTGRPVLTTPEAIRGRFAEDGAVLIGFDVRSGPEGSPFVDDNLEDVLSTEAEELCLGRCGSMRLYLWRFDGPAGQETARP